MAAAMEPGRRDREELASTAEPRRDAALPLWSPVVVTGKSSAHRGGAGRVPEAAMEPGRRDREEWLGLHPFTGSSRPLWSPVVVTGKSGRRRRTSTMSRRPLWSPVVVTGKSSPRAGRRPRHGHAAMEPGRRDREESQYLHGERRFLVAAAMEPGRRDREERRRPSPRPRSTPTSPLWSPVVVTGKSSGPGARDPEGEVGRRYGARSS